MLTGMGPPAAATPFALKLFSFPHRAAQGADLGIGPSFAAVPATPTAGQLALGSRLTVHRALLHRTPQLPPMSCCIVLVVQAVWSWWWAMGASAGPLGRRTTPSTWGRPPRGCRPTLSTSWPRAGAWWCPWAPRAACRWGLEQSCLQRRLARSRGPRSPSQPVRPPVLQANPGTLVSWFTPSPLAVVIAPRQPPLSLTPPSAAVPGRRGQGC